MFKTNFLNSRKFGYQKKFGGHCSRMPPVATGLVSNTALSGGKGL